MDVKESEEIEFAVEAGNLAAMSTAADNLFCNTQSNSLVQKRHFVGLCRFLRQQQRPAMSNQSALVRTEI